MTQNGGAQVIPLSFILEYAVIILLFSINYRAVR